MLSLRVRCLCLQFARLECHGRAQRASTVFLFVVIREQRGAGALALYGSIWSLEINERRKGVPGRRGPSATFQIGRRNAVSG